MAGWQSLWGLVHRPNLRWNGWKWRKLQPPTFLFSRCLISLLSSCSVWSFLSVDTKILWPKCQSHLITIFLGNHFNPEYLGFLEALSRCAKCHCFCHGTGQLMKSEINWANMSDPPHNQYYWVGRSAGLVNWLQLCISAEGELESQTRAD